MKPIRKIHKFDFSGKEAHVALVDKAANLQEVLVMKKKDIDVTKQHFMESGADVPTPIVESFDEDVPELKGEVQVTLSMKDFLKKFFNLWEEDAATLAGIFGFDQSVYNSYRDEDGNYLSDEEMIQRRIDSVSLLKSRDIPNALPESTYKIVEGLVKEIGDKLNTSEGSPPEDNTTKVGDSPVIKDTSEVEIEKAATSKALKEVETLKAAMKGMKDEMDASKKATMQTLVKGYSFVPSDDQEALVEALLSVGVEKSNVIIASMEKARDAVAVGVKIDTEEGVESEETKVEKEESLIEKSASIVSATIAKRKEKGNS